MLNFSLFFLLILINCLAKSTSSGPNFRIIGGSYARKGEFPYQVSLFVTGPKFECAHFCGGSIINESFIITAAHCMYYSKKVKRHSGDELLVVAGQVEKKLKPNSIRRNVRNIYIHPRFNFNRKEHDIALLQLEKELPPFNETNLIKPILLNYKKVVGGLTCTSSGWGAVEWDTVKKTPTKYSRFLKKGIFKTITLEECREKFLKSRRHPDNEIVCAEGIIGEDGEPMDICRGDSGGPLVCNGLLTGILSAGRCDRLFPGVYTDIWTHLSWIEYDFDEVPEKKLPEFIITFPATDKPLDEGDSTESGTQPNNSDSSSYRNDSDFDDVDSSQYNDSEVDFPQRFRFRNNSPLAKRCFCNNYLCSLLAIAIKSFIE